MTAYIFYLSESILNSEAHDTNEEQLVLQADRHVSHMFRYLHYSKKIITEITEIYTDIKKS